MHSGHLQPLPPPRTLLLTHTSVHTHTLSPGRVIWVNLSLELSSRAWRAPQHSPVFFVSLQWNIERQGQCREVGKIHPSIAVKGSERSLSTPCEYACEPHFCPCPPVTSSCLPQTLKHKQQFPVPTTTKKQSQINENAGTCMRKWGEHRVSRSGCSPGAAP